MKTVNSTTRLMTLVMLLTAPSVHAHIAGEHSGGLLQQLMHILQSTDHLFIILALGVVISVLIHHAIKGRH